MKKEKERVDELKTKNQRDKKKIQLEKGINEEGVKKEIQRENYKTMNEARG